LTAATQRRPLVLGKPDLSILLDLCARHHVTPNELAMVGDRLYTDVAMANKAGTLAVLVLSGEATTADVPASQHQPDLVISDIGELGKLLADLRGIHGK
jgi:NagD protein